MIRAKDLGLKVVKVSGGEELVLCPFHDDKTPSAWFNPKNGLFFCTVCSLGMNIHQLAKRMNVDIGSVMQSDDVILDYDMMHDALVLPRGVKNFSHYFRERNLEVFTVITYGLEWREEPHETAILPLEDMEGEVKGVLHRYVRPEEVGTRYKIFGEVPTVWPLPLLKAITPTFPVLVTEGPWSAMRLDSYLCGRGNPILSTLGAKANQKMVDLLSPFNCIFLYDHDKAGIFACRRMRDIMPLHWRAHTLATSPDDMDDEQLKGLVEKLWATG